MESLPAHAEMMDAFQSRNETYDGVFFTGVRTTGIFCRPVCPARKPKPLVSTVSTAQISASPTSLITLSAAFLVSARTTPRPCAPSSSLSTATGPAVAVRIVAVCG